MDPSTKPAAKDEHANAGLHIACGRSGGADLYRGLCSGRVVWLSAGSPPASTGVCIVGWAGEEGSLTADGHPCVIIYSRADSAILAREGGHCSVPSHTHMYTHTHTHERTHTHIGCAVTTFTHTDAFRQTFTYLVSKITCYIDRRQTGFIRKLK